jgi:hypothetical protein
MGLLSRLLLRRAGGATSAEPNPAGETDVLTGLGTLVSQVHAFEQSPYGARDLSGMMAQAEDMQKEIAEIVARHGFDPSCPSVGGNVADATEMQREIMEAMSRHGFGVPGMQQGPAGTQAPPASPQQGPIRNPLRP